MKDQWVGLRDVLDLLGVTKTRVSQLVREGKLHRKPHGPSGRRFRYHLQAVLDLVHKREAAAWDRTPADRDAVRRIEWLRRAGQQPLVPGDRWLTAAQAAGLLQCSQQRVGELVQQGLLYARQPKPGCRGSRLRFKMSDVLRLRDDPARRQRRAAYDKGQSRPLHQLRSRGGWPEHDIAPVPTDDPGPARKHNGVYNTRQVAALLGITPGQVLRLRREGRLTGFHKPTARKGSGNRWWFYHPDEVDRLRYTLRYQDARAKYRRSITPESRAARRSRLARAIQLQAERHLRAARALRESDPRTLYPGHLEPLDWRGGTFGFQVETAPTLPPEPARELDDLARSELDNLDSFRRLNSFGRDPDGQYTTGWSWGDSRIRGPPADLLGVRGRAKIQRR